MPHSPQPPLDIVSIAIAAATAMLSAGAGTVVGTYSVILVCALGGAAWSAGNQEPFEQHRRARTLLHILLRVGLALVVTVPIAEMASSAWPQLQVRWLFGPVAMLVAGQPPWAAGLLRGLAARIGIQPQPPKEDRP